MLLSTQLFISARFASFNQYFIEQMEIQQDMPASEDVTIVDTVSDVVDDQEWKKVPHSANKLLRGSR